MKFLIFYCYKIRTVLLNLLTIINNTVDLTSVPSVTNWGFQNNTSPSSFRIELLIASTAAVKADLVSYKGKILSVSYRISNNSALNSQVFWAFIVYGRSKRFFIDKRKKIIGKYERIDVIHNALSLPSNH